MNTFLSTAQQALQEQYLKFTEEHILPVARDLDSGKLSPREALSAMASGGYLGLTVPKEYGGQGLSLVELVLFTEAVSTANGGLGLALASHYSVVELVKNFGTDTQKSRYLSHLAAGELIGAQAFGEEQAGSDYQAVQTTVKVDGSAILSGEKTWVTNGEHAGLLAVLAKNGDDLAIYLVDGNPSSTMSVGENKGKVGMRAAASNDIKFTDHKVPAENRLGGVEGVGAGTTEKQINHVLDFSKTVLAGAALGLVDEALKFAAERARTRQQFGGPISQFQAVQWKLADLSTDVTAARLLTYRAAWSQDGEPAEFRKFAAMAKFFAAKAARYHSGEAVQIFGVLGASTESPVERLYRDSKLTEIFEGTSEIQKVVIKEELGV